MRRAAILQFTWRLVGGALALAAALLVAKSLGLATLGLVATTLTVVLGLSVVTGAGFTHAVSFMVARGPTTCARTFDRALALTFIGSIAIGALVAVAGPVAFPLLPVLWVHLAIALPFVQVGQFGLGLHQGLGSYRGYVLTYIAQPLVAFCIAVAATIASPAGGEDRWSGPLVVLPFLVQASTVVPAWLALPRELPAEPLRTLVSYTARIYPSAVMHYLSYRLDLVLVSALLGATAAGIYSLALNGVDAVARIGQAAATVLFPRFAVLEESEDASRSVRRAAAVAGALSLIASTALAAVVLTAGRFFGPEVHTVGVLLAILIVAGGGVSAWGVVASYLAARDRLAATARVNVVLLVTSVTLYVALIPTIGVHGAAIGTSVGLFVAAALGYREVAGRPASGVARSGDAR